MYNCRVGFFIFPFCKDATVTLSEYLILALFALWVRLGATELQQKIKTKKHSQQLKTFIVFLYTVFWRGPV